MGADFYFNPPDAEEREAELTEALADRARVRFVMRLHLPVEFKGFEQPPGAEDFLGDEVWVADCGGRLYTTKEGFRRGEELKFTGRSWREAVDKAMEELG